jgi:hypothetical protein
MQEHNLGNGLWVKTRFYQEGHMLHAVTYCVAAGNPEMIRLSVDLRPIAKAVRAYHDRLHKERDRNPDPHQARMKVSGLLEGDTPFHGIGEAAQKLGQEKLRTLISQSVRAIAMKAHDEAPVIGARGSPFLIPGNTDNPKHGKADRMGWNRAEVDALQFFKAVQHRAPNPAETKMLLAYVKAARAAQASGDDSARGGQYHFEGAHLRLAYYVKHLTVPRHDQVGLIDKHAAEVVDAHIQQYDAAHPSGFLSGLVHAATDIYEGAKDVVRSDITKYALAAVSVVAPEIGIPAMAAYAAANEGLDAVDKAKNAVGAAKKIATAVHIVKSANDAVKKVGHVAAQASLRAHPALAQKLRTAVAVKKAAAGVSPPVLATAKSRGEMALAKFAEIARVAREDPDPKRRAAAQKSVEILKIVAAHRAHVRSVADAHAGGIPGIQIDRHGRLVKGRFVHGHGHHDSHLYAKEGGGQGSWSRVSTDTSTVSPIDHYAEAKKHANLAAAHHDAAMKDPGKAAHHRQVAAHHAKAAAAHKVSGDIAIGCCEVGRGGHRGGGRGGHRGGRGGWYGYGPGYYDDDEVPVLFVTPP